VAAQIVGQGNKYLNCRQQNSQALAELNLAKANFIFHLAYSLAKASGN
jgi:hypothetical protein